MATQILGQPGGSTLFPGNGNMGMALANDMYNFHDISKAELVAPQLIMLANVALNGEVGGSDYQAEEERQMAELTTVGYSNFLDGKGEDLEGSVELESDSDGFEYMEWELSDAPKEEAQKAVTETFPNPSNCTLVQDVPGEVSGTPESADDKSKGLKSKPFRCKPCQYEAESEKEFVHHIKIHSAKKFIVGEDAEKLSQTKESDFCTAEEADFSKGPIRCSRCGYNTNRYDHYLAHLKHHNKAGESERVYKCTICTYTTVSEYHWKKHLRNHFPRKVYTCSQCSYFSDRKNNYIQHIRTHTGERPYQCSMCPYSSSQKTHLTRHMRTHSGEKPFKCEQCSYVAANQHEVTRHARQVHNGPKPLTCPHCDYKTADRSNFKKHVELHVNPRQFLCPVCDYAASKKCNLQYHLKSRHPDCSDITMDVSKVKLRTKKNETDFSDSAASEKSDREPTKFKGETEEKKNERAVNVENRESSKDKKANTGASVGQVTTRSHKVAPENKNVVEMRTEKSMDKSSKTKGVKRKTEDEATSVKQDLTDGKHVPKKKMKLEHKTKACQEIQKKHIKCKASKKQKSCLKKGRKKKILRNKYKKKIRKLAAQGKHKEKSIPGKPVLVKEDNVITNCSDNWHKEQVSINDTPMLDNVAHVLNTGKSKKNELPTREEAVNIEVKAHKWSANTEKNRKITKRTKPKKQPEYEGLTGRIKELSSVISSEQTVTVLQDIEVPNRCQADPIKVPYPCPVDAIEAPAGCPEDVIKAPAGCPEDVIKAPASCQADAIEAPVGCPADATEASDGCPADATEASDVCPADATEASDGCPADATEASDGCSADATEASDGCPADATEASDGCPADATEASDGCPADAVEAPDGCPADAVEAPDGCPADAVEAPDTNAVPHRCPVDKCAEGLGESYEDHQEDAEDRTCEILEMTHRNLIENQSDIDTPTEEKTKAQYEQNLKEAVFVPPQGNTGMIESLEMDEDEGIHSHDGSDISDNISERSDDSGLNGAQSIPEAMGSKTAVPESSKSKVTVETFMCIFCDRTFRKEGEYSKHLNRHLVNVYYLEKAAKGQE